MQRERIEIIQIIRFLGAVCIVLYHSGLVGEHGYFGVEIFSIISGYIIVYSTRQTEDRKNFLLKRFIRIVPLYWLMTLFMYAIICLYPALSIMSEAKPEYLIKSMLFLPFQNSRGYNVPILGVGWTLNYEVLFYLIFFAAICLNHSHRSIIAGAMITFLTIIGCAFRISAGGVPFCLNYYTDSFLLEFAFGILAFYIIEYLQKRVTGKGSRMICFVLAFISFVWMFLDLTVSSSLPRSIRIGIPALIFFCSVLLWGRTIHFKRIFLELGNMSFSIYLVEYFTTAIYKIIAGNQPIVFKIIIFMIMILITLFISYISYRVIEVRFTGWIKGKMKRVKVQP